MKPGRALDIAVGRHVMHDEGLGVLIPEYSTDIAAAWQVVEQLRVRNIGLLVKAYPIDMNYPFTATVPGDGKTFAWGTTAQHAICLAALQAVGAEVSR